MMIAVTNAQREVRVDPALVRCVGRCAVRQLRIRARGRMEVSLIDARRMRGLNRAFKRHDWTTDVLSFRYDGRTTGRGSIRRVRPGTVVGEVLIAPRQARAYARRHRLRFEEELSRYVVHGLLHWLGHDDATKAQQARMRTREDRLLRGCRQLQRVLR